MPLIYITVPEDERAEFLEAVEQLSPEDAEIVAETDDPDAIGLLFADSYEPEAAAQRVAQIIRGAAEVAGHPFTAIASGEVGWS